ncbi:MAG: glycoside hydrolase family 28 protein [Taibaiella sp.]
MKTRSVIAFSVILLNSLGGNIAFAQKYSWNNLPIVQATSFKKDTFKITQYGAKADGFTLNTDAIQKTIDACNAKGGGIVLIPDGLWLTAPITLKSNVNLHLADNALLQFTADKSKYNLVAGEWEGEPSVRNQSPVSATNETNIAITGKGIIDGNGDVWRAVKKDKLTESQWKKLVASGGSVRADGKMWFPSASYVRGNNVDKPGRFIEGKSLKDYEQYKDFFRPNMVVLTGCKKVLLEGVTFQNSAAWNLHTILCEDLTVRNVYAKNPWYAQNGDGIDIESCKNVLVEGSTFDVGDDGICIKSGRDAAGRKRGVPTENVIVRNSTVYHAHGGFVVGSEMSGGARNLFVYDCSFIGTDIGLRFKTTRGRGGVVESVYAKNIVMKDIAGAAILFDMYYMAKDPVLLNGEKEEDIKAVTYPVTEETPQFRDFHISNVVCNGADKAIFVRGLPEMNIKNISVENSIFQADQGVEIIEGSNINLKNVSIEIKKKQPVIVINNGTDLALDNIAVTNIENRKLFEVSGDKTKRVMINGKDAVK